MKEQTLSAKYRVEVGRSDTAMPSGMAKVLDMLGASIQPPANKAMGVEEADPAADANGETKVGKAPAAP
ncbi:hypothetical protein [Chromobacterium haemolyticum]|uniref:hypothetical protein n=1 Tax=Chromobacterium TaxID=535 RepID=UPI004055B54B